MADGNGTPTFVVLGATGGIGSEVCRRLSADGANLVLGARTESDLDALASEVGGTAHPLDATQFEDVQGIIDAATDEYGAIDGIISAVGSILLKPAHLTSIEEYRETVALNLDTAFFTVKAGARALMKNGGSIVLSASAVAQVGLNNHEAIAAAKAGIMGLTRSAAATYARRGVRVNAVAPGLVETPMSEHILSSDQGRKQSEAMHALGRLGQPDDIARAICWLVDPENDWVTGQVLGVDGGLGTLKT
jgi:NAD(P)-dependent dehydrogenase (short-subunit alcohol dehydrogenase family)